MLRQKPGPDRWKVRRNGTGKLTIFDCDGNEILKHPDPLVRAQAIYLAGAAYAQHQVLVQMTRRLKRAVEGGFGDRRDRELLIEAECALSDAIPELREMRRERGSQSELDL